MVPFGKKHNIFSNGWLSHSRADQASGGSRVFQSGCGAHASTFTRTDHVAVAGSKHAALPKTWKYKLKRCSNKECCKQCRYVMFKGTMTKWPVQKLTQGTIQKLLQHHDATDI